MNNEEKILAILSQMQEEQKQIREDVSDLKSAHGAALRLRLVKESDPDVADESFPCPAGHSCRERE